MTSQQDDDESVTRSDGSSEPDQQESEGDEQLSPGEQAKRETEHNRPDVGYHLIERDTMKEPWRQNTALKHTHSLKLSEMSVPEDSSIVKKFVIDEHLNKYDDELRTDSEKTVAELGEELETALDEDDEKASRLVLARLARAVEADPSSCVGAVDVVTRAIERDSPPVQAEALGILRGFADIEPEILSGTIEPTVTILERDVHPKLTVEALRFLTVLIPSFPEETARATPALVRLLDDDDVPDEPIANVLVVVARERPAALTNVLQELGGYLEADGKPEAAQTQVLAALGRTAKEYPTPVSDLAPHLVELLDSQHPKVRVNAAGVLADVADDNPTAVESAIPHVMDLLEGDDTRGRHNAASIVARVAEGDPHAVQSARDTLIELLEADDVGTRLNACSAVKSMNAESALSVLEERQANDPDREVRQAAKQAIETIANSD